MLPEKPSFTTADQINNPPQAEIIDKVLPETNVNQTTSNLGLESKSNLALYSAALAEIESSGDSDYSNQHQEKISPAPTEAALEKQIQPQAWSDAFEEIEKVETEEILELTIADISGFRKNPATNLLFEVALEELLPLEQKSLYATTIDRSTQAKVENQEVKKAFYDFKQDEKKLEARKIQWYKDSIRINVDGPTISVTGASIPRRMAATIIDGAIVLATGSAFTLLSVAPEGTAAAITSGEITLSELSLHLGNLGAWSIATWIVYNTMLITFNQQTVGQKALKLKVSDWTGDPINSSRAFLRAVSQIWTLISLGLGMLPALGKKGLALHDRLSHSAVCLEDNQS